MNTTRKHIHQQAQPIPSFRQWLGYVLLVCFLNPIIFPDIHVPVAIKKWQTSHSISADNTSPTEYLPEDYLDIEDLTPIHPGEDVEDILKTIDDLDLIDHEGLIINFIPLSEKNPIHNLVNLLAILTYYSSPTPPPEC